MNQQSTRISSPPLESSTSRTAGDRPQDGPAARPTDITEEDQGPSTRRRSSSEPRRGRFSAPPAIMLTRLTSRESEYPMSPVSEESPSQLRSSSDLPSHERNLLLVPSLSGDQEGEPKEPTLRSSIRRQLLDSVSTGRRNRASTVSVSTPVQRRLASDEYDSHIVDLLDVVDPEVSTLSTLTNVQNSLFVPDLGSLLNRTPTYTLSPRGPESSDSDEGLEDAKRDTTMDENLTRQREPSMQQIRAVRSLSSVLGEERYAVLPDGATLEGWTEEEIQELNDHVRHMLHSRRSKFKRAMKGFGQYVRKPLGFFVTVYALLITIFGLAWVLFLIGWINVGGRQLYIINVIDNVLVALFAIMGDGLAPFRARDTYHMIFIAHYHHLTWRLRKKCTLPKLRDKNDLPSRLPDPNDLESGGKDVDPNDPDAGQFSVLTPRQQQRLEYHSRKFAKSHTFYKPHETATHRAFPLRLLVAIVVLLDFHSIFQIALGACTWGIDYRVRPFALTTVILCCSLTCSISGGVLITIGDRMTRKKEVVRRMFRQKLTSEAMRKIEKKRRKKEFAMSRSDTDTSSRT